MIGINKFFLRLVGEIIQSVVKTAFREKLPSLLLFLVSFSIEFILGLDTLGGTVVNGQFSSGNVNVTYELKKCLSVSIQAYRNEG
jgi:hypothetical protein